MLILNIFLRFSSVRTSFLSPENIICPASPVPVCSTLVMTSEGVFFRPMKDFGALLHTDEGAGRVNALINEMLDSGKAFTAVELSIAARKLWPPEKACCYTHLVYSCLREKLKAGTIVRINDIGQASLPGAGVPEWRFCKA